MNNCRMIALRSAKDGTCFCADPKGGACMVFLTFQIRTTDLRATMRLSKQRSHSARHPPPNLKIYTIRSDICTPTPLRRPLRLDAAGATALRSVGLRSRLPLTVPVTELLQN